MTTLITGALCLNLTLLAVAETRATEPVLYPVTKDPAAYACLVGLPYGYGHLIDTEVYFQSDDGRLHGPWLVVDVESKHHAPHMAVNDLAADINCPDLVHQAGTLWVRQ